MPEVPRDPRQLARDILSGKIKIEDLARERARQAGGAKIPPAGAARPQGNVPLPRQAPVQARPMNAPRPMVRGGSEGAVRGPGMPQVRPGRTMPTVVVAPPRQRVESRPVQGPWDASPAKGKQQAGSEGAAEGEKKIVHPAYGAGDQARKTERSGGQLRKLLQSKEGMGKREMIRQGILMAEILGKPVALRE